MTAPEENLVFLNNYKISLDRENSAYPPGPPLRYTIILRVW